MSPTSLCIHFTEKLGAKSRRRTAGALPAIMADLAALFGKGAEAVTPNERAFGKSVNFGTLFGQGRRGLMALAVRHGLTLSEYLLRGPQQSAEKPTIEELTQRIESRRLPKLKTHPADLIRADRERH